MDNDFDPVVGNWYAHVDDEKTFVVLAVDEDKGVVEVRYEDGEVEELDLGEWADLDLEQVEPPEDWAGGEEDEELGGGELYEDTGTWQAPSRPRPGKSWEDADDDDEDEDYDDWEESEDY